MDNTALKRKRGRSWKLIPRVYTMPEQAARAIFLPSGPAESSARNSAGRQPSGREPDLALAN